MENPPLPSKYPSFMSAVDIACALISVPSAIKFYLMDCRPVTFT